MKREDELMEEGIRWIEEGGWEDKLAGRKCASVCVEVVSGFEEVCDGWRERLFSDTVGVEVVAG